MKMARLVEQYGQMQNNGRIERNRFPVEWFPPTDALFDIESICLLILLLHGSFANLQK